MAKIGYPIIIIAPVFKPLRSEVIRDYMKVAGFYKAICFSCGNSSQALVQSGVDVLEFKNPTGQWWTPAEIHNRWPNCFDATPGHLPFHLTVEISKKLKNTLEYDLDGSTYLIPTGSGETITCMRMVFPDVKFRPIDLKIPATQRHPECVLEPIIELGGLKCQN